MDRHEPGGISKSSLMMSRFAILLILVPVAAIADSLPLFDSNETLHLTIEAPLRTLIRKADERPVVDGTARYVDSEGNEVELPVQVSTRGKSRLRVCRFPPLSLAMKKKAAAGTVFEGQKSLKIVTHCQSHVQFRSYLHQEYGIYEGFNVLTDVSFRSRYLNVTYRDSEGRVNEIQEPAFFIESINEIAARTGLERQKTPRIETSQLDPYYTILATMYQFLIGNTDWSVKLAPSGANCCHNGRVLSEPDKPDGWMVVPYDFDQTGIINPRYAEPAEQLGLRSVRQRLWRGRCVHNAEIDKVIDIFNEKRDEITNALLVDGIRDPRSVHKYIDMFYEIINDPKQRQRQIFGRCMAG
jgi:hypothetical protein